MKRMKGSSPNMPQFASSRPRTPMPHELWAEADRTCPDDPEARRELYIDLMRVWGHIIPSTDEDAPSFTCGDSMKEWIGDE